jgi:methionyl-tRNA formyltransferase
MENIRIIFMGTPEFAVPSLDLLYKAGYNIVGVVTAPDKPAGRGMKLSESEVKKYAVKNNLKVLQPDKLKDPDFIEELRQLNADLQVVVAFRMLPEMVWKMPPLGTINLHASLLPQYRGAAPINWAIINGEKETGVTTFKLQQEIDTGNILLQEKIKISHNETAGTLHDKMKSVGAAILLKTIQQLQNGSLHEHPQHHTTSLHPAPKIFSNDCKINWDQNVEDVFNFIRGLSPYPAAFTFLQGRKLKIFSGEKQQQAGLKSAGDYVTDNKSYLKFAAKDGYISIKELQLEGKKRMNVADFLRGWRE